MIQISNSIEIGRPPAQVFAYLANFENNPQWMPVQQVQQTSSKPVGKGTRFKQRFLLFGASYEMDCAITEFVPNKRISFEYDAPVFDWQGQYLLEPTPTGTRLSAKGTVKLGGPYKMAETLFAPRIRKLINDTAPKLKQILER